jgi:hypothetical protein
LQDDVSYWCNNFNYEKLAIFGATMHGVVSATGNGVGKIKSMLFEVQVCVF